ncbi:MAG: lipopolysaccharide export system permease protein [Alphaproteobacteria bacterium]|jgi:lipopolysaccharide export system permease protein|nr:lipopolysaccharide export system permease protein [Alphaproteobacteria bacterium]
MGSIGRYIFRATLGAFLVICVSVTALMWITQALRDIDLMTNQGQSIFVFVGITGLIIPLLVQIIAPIALMIAVAHVLNKLGNDSELIVMNAAGMPPWVLFRPFLAVGIVVSLLVAAISIYISPWGLRELRRWATEVRADLVGNIVQPGRFSKMEERLTLHIQERLPDGQLRGIFIDDQRDPKERATILAERGDIVKNERGLFLVLENGSVQRHETGQRDPTLVLFDSYGFDLSSLTSGPQRVRYSVRERYLWELYDPTRTDMEFADQPEQIRAEFHDRLTAPLYPLAFVVLTYAYLGAPRTTRQSRTMSLMGAIGLVSALRGIGFVGMIAGVHTPIALLLPYLALGTTFVLGYVTISRGVIIEPPAFITNAITAVMERIAQRTGALTGQTP